MAVKSHAEGLGVAALSCSPLVTLADSSGRVTGHQEVTTVPRAPGEMLPLRVTLCIGHVCCRFNAMLAFSRQSCEMKFEKSN